MKYRKKPVVIEAIQWIGAFNFPLPQWIAEAAKNETIKKNGSFLEIKTLEGPIYASINDWVIKGVKGEIYPCKPDIFEASYDLVEETEDQGEDVLGYTGKDK